MKRTRDTGLAAAIDDLKNHTLSAFPGEMARMVYLSATRDYNTGHYYHDGLALRFSDEVAEAALAACHREVFRKLSACSLEDFSEELTTYIEAAAVPVAQLVEAWRKLEPYRVVIPLDSDPLAAELFYSNLKIALAVLDARLPAED